MWAVPDGDDTALYIYPCYTCAFCHCPNHVGPGKRACLATATWPTRISGRREGRRYDPVSSWAELLALSICVTGYQCLMERSFGDTRLFLARKFCNAENAAGGLHVNRLESGYSGTNVSTTQPKLKRSLVSVEAMMEDAGFDGKEWKKGAGW
ncbi:hypothetical protein BS50DRAFT_589569 [Corynespora cassiicola Philippines]|uniref:Uncharacterized protein n=1 Tax=Corynespora cassiicola Philippines TaxID=1448308 RepID=A0A2T2NJA9_CORCC|nr:hypothetical protein BS50DRAFT_589569 [Corynespora cassiicola Philippines]